MYASVLGEMLSGGMAACETMYTATRTRLHAHAQSGNVLAQLLAVRPLDPAQPPADIPGAPAELRAYVRALADGSIEHGPMPAVEHVLFDDALFVAPFLRGGAAALPTSTAVMRELWGAAVDHSVDPIYENADAGVYVCQCYVRVPGGGKRLCVVRRQRCTSAYAAVFESVAAVYPALELLRLDTSYPVCVPIANALAIDDGELCCMSLMFKAGPSMHVLARTAPLQQVRMTLQLVHRLCTSPAHAASAQTVFAHGDEHSNNLLFTPRGVVLIDFGKYSHSDAGFGAAGAAMPRELVDEWARVTGCAPARAPRTLGEAGARMPLGIVFILAEMRKYSAVLAKMDSRDGAALHDAIARFDERVFEPAMRWLDGLVERRGDGICASDTDIAFLVLEAAAARANPGRASPAELQRWRRQAVRYTVYGVEAILRARSCPSWQECTAFVVGLQELAEQVRLPQ